MAAPLIHTLGGNLDQLLHGFAKAFALIISLDPEVLEITRRTLEISLSSCFLATVICLPLASLIHFHKFVGKRLLINLVQTFYSMPTVVVGLIVFLIFSRTTGPLGVLNLMFTPRLMVIGQVVLISPIILGLTISALVGVDRNITDTARSLGAGGWQTAWIIMLEARFAVIAAITLGFGRAISEVGLALMVGGNIRGYTRVLTTTIALETSKGDIELAIALGIILIVLSLIVNLILNQIQQRR
jgi:tungstate transport system permease protein